jgi:hypothetical protein
MPFVSTERKYKGYFKEPAEYIRYSLLRKDPYRSSLYAEIMRHETASLNCLKERIIG